MMDLDRLMYRIHNKINHLSIINPVFFNYVNDNFTNIFSSIFCLLNIKKIDGVYIKHCPIDKGSVVSQIEEILS